MTELLQEAMAQTASLPPDEQNFIAAMLLENIRYARIWIEPTDERQHDEFFEALEGFESSAVDRRKAADQTARITEGPNNGPGLVMRRVQKSAQVL